MHKVKKQDIEYIIKMSFEKALSESSLEEINLSGIEINSVFSKLLYTNPNTPNFSAYAEQRFVARLTELIQRYAGASTKVSKLEINSNKERELVIHFDYEIL